MKSYLILFIMLFFPSIVFAQDNATIDNKTNEITINIKGFCTFESKCFISYDKIQNALPSEIKIDVRKKLQVNSFQSSSGIKIKFFMDEIGIQYFMPSWDEYIANYENYEFEKYSNGSTKQFRDTDQEIPYYPKPHIIKGFINNKPLTILLTIYWYQHLED